MKFTNQQLKLITYLYSNPEKLQLAKEKLELVESSNVKEFIDSLTVKFCLSWYQVIYILAHMIAMKKDIDVLILRLKNIVEMEERNKDDN